MPNLPGNEDDLRTPHATEAELTLVQFMVAYPSCIPAILTAGFTSEWCFTHDYRQVARTALYLHEAGVEPHWHIVQSALKTNDTALDDPLAFNEFDSGIPRPSADSLIYFVGVLRDRDLRRRVLAATTKFRAQIADLDISPENAIQSFEDTKAELLAQYQSPARIEDLPAFLQRLASQPEPAWHIVGLIPDEGICLWHGQPRDFKTMCALETGLALASGRSAFHDERFRVKQALRVAYFSEEDPERLVAARLHWLTAKTGVPDTFFPFIRKGLSFDHPEDRLFILRRIKECKAQVCVFDPVRSYTGLSDKGPAELHPVTMFLRQIQNETTAKTILLVHHDTKPLATAPTNPDRTRSQQASGGGIFSISDCPVAFKKLDWNTVAVFPEDSKFAGNPKPFEVTFETDVWLDESGAHRFGKWITPTAVSKIEQEIADGAVAKKVLAFLSANYGHWFTNTEIEAQAHLRKDSTRNVLKQLHEEKRIKCVTGNNATHLGRSSQALLYSGDKAMPLVDGDAPSDSTTPGVVASRPNP